MAAARTTRGDHASEEPTVIDTDSEVRELLGVLDDADCRAILEEAGEEFLSAREFSERCDIPLSTTYRKLDLLVDAGLLAEGTRIRRSGNHTSECARRLEDS